MCCDYVQVCQSSNFFSNLGLGEFHHKTVFFTWRCYRVTQISFHIPFRFFIDCGFKFVFRSDSFPFSDKCLLFILFGGFCCHVWNGEHRRAFCIFFGDLYNPFSWFMYPTSCIDFNPGLIFDIDYVTLFVMWFSIIVFIHVKTRLIFNKYAKWIEIFVNTVLHIHRILSLMTIVIPLVGVVVAPSWIFGGISVCGQVKKVNRFRTLHNVNLASIRANRIPIQFLGPAPKGNQAIGWRPCDSSGENLKERHQID